MGTVLDPNNRAAARAQLDFDIARLKRQGVDVTKNSVGGTRGASTKRPPQTPTPGHVFLFGREVSATEATSDARAAGELRALMASEPYQNQSHLLHAATQLAVEKLFKFLHPEEPEE